MSKYRIRIEDAETGERADYCGLPGEALTEMFIVSARVSDPGVEPAAYMVAAAGEYKAKDLPCMVNSQFKGMRKMGEESRAAKAAVSASAGLELLSLLSDWLGRKQAAECLAALAEAADE